MRSGRRKELDGRKVNRRKPGSIMKLFPELVAIAQSLECWPGMHKTLGVRPEIPALKIQRQRLDLEIKTIFKQFKASLECPRSFPTRTLLKPQGILPEFGKT